MTSSDFWAAFATVVAVLSAALSVYVAYHQLRIQSLEKYLSAALYGSVGLLQGRADLCRHLDT
jgi:hypothetical protein